MVERIKEAGILHDFPGRTAADIYHWIMDHRYYLSLEQGHSVGADTAVRSYDARYNTWQRRVGRFLRRLLEQASRPLVITRDLLRRALAAGARTMSEAHLLPLLPPDPPKSPL